MLSRADWVYPGEPPRRMVALVVAIVIWLILFLGTVGIAVLYVAGFALFWLFAQSAVIAYLRGTAVRITAQQMPDLHARLLQCCKTLQVDKVPEAYLLHGNGVFNAFVTRFLGRDFIVLLSDVVDALDARPGAINFYIGHELAHIRQKHLAWGPALAPALVLPLLGAAYARACEYTCDRHGLACCDNAGDALRGMAALAAGRERWQALDLPQYQDQVAQTGGFWMSFHELIGDYPWLTKRMTHVAALGEDEDPQLPRRHWAAYVLSALVPRMPGAGSGAASMFVMVAMIGVLAAIAIPSYQEYTQRAAIAGALGAARPYQAAVLSYVREHQQWPVSNSDLSVPATAAAPLPGVLEIAVEDQGVVRISMSGGLLGKSLYLTPSIDDQELHWRCSSGEIAPRLLPPQCR